MTTDSTIAARITAIEPRLRKIASGMARDAFQADDLFQAAALRIITTCAPDNTDTIIVIRAQSAMRNAITNDQRYDYFVAAEDTLAGSPSVEDEDVDVWDRYETEQKSPEDLLIDHEEMTALDEAIASLSPENQKVVRMLAIGKSQSEIARELGVTRAAISMRVNTIAKSLGRQMLAV